MMKVCRIGPVWLDYATAELLRSNVRQAFIDKEGGEERMLMSGNYLTCSLPSRQRPYLSTCAM